MDNYCIDLDGSLIKTDLFIESLWKYVKLNPLHFARVMWWLRKGRSYVKFRLARRVSVEAETLPYDHDIVAYLKELKMKGHNVYLVTGSTEKWAQKVAEHLKVFNMVMASSAEKNLVNRNKQKALEESFGKHNFYYMGNSRSDFSVFSSAKGAITVGSSKFRKRVEKIAPIHYHFHRNIFSWKHLFDAIRVKHWAKNILIFFPFLFFTGINQVNHFISEIIAFFSFSSLASTVYILNDLLDLESDRDNLLKRKRPFASGNLTLIVALVAMPLLAIISFTLASFLPQPFLMTLILYFFVTTLYSFYLKKVVGIDIMVLSSLYLLRLLSGSEAINLPISTYAYSFCGLFFGGWALMKRYTEVRDLRYQNTKKVEGRGYQLQDEGVVLATGIMFSLTAIILLAFLLRDESNFVNYTSPLYLWFEIPLIFYMNFRFWILASRESLKTEPILFILKDRISHIILVLMLAIFLVAKFLSI